MTELDERRLVMRTAEGPFPMETTYTWEPLGERRTRMTLRNRGEPSGFSKLTAPILSAAMRRANRKDVAKLKSVLEAPNDGGFRERLPLNDLDVHVPLRRVIGIRRIEGDIGAVALDDDVGNDVDGHRPPL